MGQQQLLLVVLGVIVIGIAISVAILLFESSSQSSNRDRLVDDLTRLGAIAQEYYMKPSTMAGGDWNFKGFALSPSDTGNADGSFAVRTSPPNDADPLRGSTSPISTSTQRIYIIGYGVEIGNNSAQAVKAYAAVTSDSVSIYVVN